jgi:hypothetical protein
MRILSPSLLASAALLASLTARAADPKPPTTPTKPATSTSTSTSTSTPTSTATPTPTATSTATSTKPPSPAPALAPSAEVPEETYGHAHQFNFRTEFLTGYRMQFRYDKSPRCAPWNYDKPNRTDQQKFCGYGAAPGLGIALGFALLDFFEPYVMMRFGLSNEASQTNSGKLLQVGAGARIYTMSDSRFKIFFSPWLGVDLTEGPVYPIGTGARGDPGADDSLAGVENASYRTDLLVHLDIGPQYDLSKGFGIYMSGGLTFQMLRYLGASADLAIGVQLRAP